MSETFTIQVLDRTITARRPTHGELDLTMLRGLCSRAAEWKAKLEAIEAGPQSGDAERSVHLVTLAEEALEKIVARVRKAIVAIAPGEVAWFDAGTELDRVTRAMEIAASLILALAPPRHIPK